MRHMVTTYTYTIQQCHLETASVTTYGLWHLSRLRISLTLSIDVMQAHGAGVLHQVRQRPGQLHRLLLPERSQKVRGLDEVRMSLEMRE